MLQNGSSNLDTNSQSKLCNGKNCSSRRTTRSLHSHSLSIFLMVLKVPIFIVLIAVFEKKWKHQSIICIPVTCQLLGVLSPVLTVRLENQCEIQLTWHTFGQACGKVRSWGVTRQRKRKRTHPCHSRAHSSACVFVFNCISHAFRKIISSNR